MKSFISNYIHKVALVAGKQNQAKKGQRKGSDHAAYNHACVQMARSVKGDSKKLYWRAHGVGVGQPAEFLRQFRQRIDDWRGVHAKLDSKDKQNVKVAVLCRKRAYDKAQASAKDAHPQDNQGKAKCPPSDLYPLLLDKDRVQENRGQKDKLHQKLYHMKAAGCNGACQTRKVNLSKNVLVCRKCL